MINKKDLQIVWQSTMKCACDLIPENMKGTDEGYELFKQYHEDIFDSFIDWIYQESDKEEVEDIGEKVKTIDDLE